MTTNGFDCVRYSHPHTPLKKLANFFKNFGLLSRMRHRRHCFFKHQGPVARSLVSANRWLRGVKTYRFPWYLTLVSANHASSNPGLDGRWRRRRHIGVKAGARPTSRSTRLSMLSNNATATSRQFSKRTTLLLRLQKLLVAYDDFWWL